ncbi:hypothetical protein HYALB_00003173 [Hymenoscyphus albidus]|uniref:Uncharacterized protein n=1 Tax=Hymenoscyphus albidus TaxID=595503 RepID=A0A9N9LAN9_9HELO|nr:hypothetical protein HYALB_00003173 [Hymenoscyphus albidus]
MSSVMKKTTTLVRKATNSFRRTISDLTSKKEKKEKQPKCPVCEAPFDGQVCENCGSRVTTLRDLRRRPSQETKPSRSGASDSPLLEREAVKDKDEASQREPPPPPPPPPPRRSNAKGKEKQDAPAERLSSSSSLE